MLKPGGRLLISDYCTTEGELSQGMRSYVQQRGYHLLAIADYAQVLQEAGFVDVVGEDRTSQVGAQAKLTSSVRCLLDRPCFVPGH